jgi:hypothetical protein
VSIFEHVLTRLSSFLRRSPLGMAACCIFLIASIWVVFNTRRWNNREVMQWDSDGYYLYLPAAFIHGDLLDLHFLSLVAPPRFPKDYRFGQGAIPVEATGHYCHKYTMGTALFELPFFLIAHAWCSLLPSAGTADGYSPPYHLSVAIATAVWACIGLLILLRFLRRYLDDPFAALALLALSMGTNLFFYSSFASGMSHPFLFTLCAMVIERMDAWRRAPSLDKALVIGAAVGWATLTRPTAALFALIPLCWWLFAERPHRAVVWRHALWAGLVGLIAMVPQLLYWKASTGSFIHYSYGEERFDFRDPHILQGVFGFRKGWLVYSPLVILGGAGLGYMLRRSAGRPYAFMVLCFLLPFLYVTFSWTQWWYGGGFGSRVMIESIPLLMLPTGLLLTAAWKTAAPVRAGFLLVVFMGISLNLFQQWQYLHGIIKHDGMDRALYWRTFLAPSHEAAGLPLDP